ncbi:pitrilysin family protein [Desulfobacterales bacterium HSG16]|nr:pitrilysin family protein [Desulfobacterales bacterium HSG16]
MEFPANKTVLKNGVRILSVKMPHLRSVSMGVWVNVGARDEAASENGLSHFIEHMIFKGTHKRTAFEIAKEFDLIGGHTNAFTGMETTCYHARVLDTHMPVMIDILSDIFLNSVFDDKEVERERPVIFHEIDMVEDSPEDYIHVLSERAFWGENSLGRSILGTQENVVRFDSNIIKNFFHRFYQPDRVVIAIAGNVDHENFVDLIGPAFESIKSGNPTPERVTPKGCSLVELHDKSIEQVHISLETTGLAVGDPRRYALSILNTIFGGNMSSRLFQEIREKKSLAYTVYSFMATYGDTGMWGAYAGVSPDKAKEAVSLIIKEILRIRTEKISSVELDDAKQYLTGNLYLASESVDNQMVRLAQNEIHFHQQHRLEQIVNKINAATREDILDLAGDLFKENRPTLTMLGPVKEKNAFDDMMADF